MDDTSTLTKSCLLLIILLRPKRFRNCTTLCTTTPCKRRRSKRSRLYGAPNPLHSSRLNASPKYIPKVLVLCVSTVTAQAPHPDTSLFVLFTRLDVYLPLEQSQVPVEPWILEVTSVKAVTRALCTQSSYSACIILVYFLPMLGRSF